jgi:hypothetical protein
MELQVLQFVRKERCRKILRALVSEPNNFAFRREDIVKRLGNEERRVLDNFLQRMRRLGVLVADEGRALTASAICYTFSALRWRFGGEHNDEGGRTR